MNVLINQIPLATSFRIDIRSLLDKNGNYIDFSFKCRHVQRCHVVFIFRIDIRPRPDKGGDDFSFSFKCCHVKRGRAIPVAWSHAALGCRIDICTRLGKGRYNFSVPT